MSSHVPADGDPLARVFRCERWRCSLSVQACLARRAERRDWWEASGAVRQEPRFPDCAACPQGRELADQVAGGER